MKEPEEKTEIERTTEEKSLRATATMTAPYASRFVLATKDQSHQYFNVYQNRMKQLRASVVEAVNRHQEAACTAHPVEERILEIRLGVTCFIIGVIFKEMPLKPNVLREYTKEQAILLVPEHQNFVSPKDSLILEDDGGRVKLVVDDPTLVSRNVTGVVVAVLGQQIEGGAFKVETILNPGLPTQTPRTVPSRLRIAEEGGPKYVALVSDLNIGSPTLNPLYSSLLSDYICGYLGSSENDQKSVTQRIVRTILVGNTFCPQEEAPVHSKLRDHTKSFTVLDQARLETVLKEVDAFVYELCTNMPVDLIPGPKDPSNFSMPQQAINKCLLPRASQFTSLHLSTNPFFAVVEGVSMLGHSGQPTANIQNYVTLNTDETILDLLQQTLEWRHMAPTAPDTLSAFPFKTHDPFVIDDCPHVYFVGDQEEFESRRITGASGQVVQLISVPSFEKTSSFVLLNLETLDAHPVSLKLWD